MPHSFVSSRHRNRAKSLRQTMTRAETLLWRYLKAHHVDGLGFRRQVPIGSFIADFVCYSAYLVIELDGETHDFQSRQRNDEARDAWFKSQGYRVLRFRNGDVLENLSGVVESIRIAAQQHKIPPSLSLPHKGGGNTQTPIRRTATLSPALPRKREMELASTSSEIDSSEIDT